MNSSLLNEIEGDFRLDEGGMLPFKSGHALAMTLSQIEAGINLETIAFLGDRVFDLKIAGFWTTRPLNRGVGASIGKLRGLKWHA